MLIICCPPGGAEGQDPPPQTLSAFDLLASECKRAFFSAQVGQASQFKTLMGGKRSVELAHFHLAFGWI